MDTVKLVAILCIFVTGIVYIGLVVYLGRIMKNVANKALSMFEQELKQQSQQNGESPE